MKFLKKLHFYIIFTALVTFIIGLFMIYFGVKFRAWDWDFFQGIRTKAFFSSFAFAFFLFAISGFGLYSVYKANYRFLSAYSIILMLTLLGVVQILAVSYAFRHSMIEKIGEEAKESLVESIKDEDDEMKEKWEKYQNENDCCGVFNYTDWKSYHDIDEVCPDDYEDLPGCLEKKWGEKVSLIKKMSFFFCAILVVAIFASLKKSKQLRRVAKARVPDLPSESEAKSTNLIQFESENFKGAEPDDQNDQDGILRPDKLGQPILAATAAKRASIKLTKQALYDATKDEVYLNPPAKTSPKPVAKVSPKPIAPVAPMPPAPPPPMFKDDPKKVESGGSLQEQLKVRFADMTGEKELEKQVQERRDRFKSDSEDWE